jgi:hypothetical protein
MTSTRRAAVAAGVLFLITHITSVAGLALYNPILHNARYVVDSGPDTQVLLGALCEVLLALSVVGTAVALFPVVKRWSEGAALGYVGLRTLEAAVIGVGVVALLAVVTLRQGDVGTEASLLTAGSALVAVHDWTFLIGPNFVLATNTVVLAYVLYRSRLVPRFIPVLGLIGGPMVFAAAVGVLFGAFEQVSTIGAIAALPVFAWELSLAIRLLTKGFDRTAATGEAAFGSGRPVPQPAGSGA